MKYNMKTEDHIRGNINLKYKQLINDLKKCYGKAKQISLTQVKQQEVQQPVVQQEPVVQQSIFVNSNQLFNYHHEFMKSHIPEFVQKPVLYIKPIAEQPFDQEITLPSPIYQPIYPVYNNYDIYRERKPECCKNIINDLEYITHVNMYH